MAEIIGVKFKESGKLYYFQPNDQYLLTGTKVIVETSRGVECGEVVMERRSVPDDQITHELKKVLREATAEDLKRVQDNHKKEASAFTVCEKKILDHGLDMKLVSVEYAFDGSKIQFCFTADGRVDFRELVKDLASVFHTRIELRQIGVRDEAKMLGGLGICGRPFCCSSFLGDFIPVSIKMAKEQGLSLNPVKISGACGRLMCCLKYEEEAYQDLSRHTPKVGMHVNTPEGTGTVFEVNLITGNLRIVMDNMPEAAPRTFNKTQVSAIGGGEGLSEAEAAMFSSYRHEEPVTEEEQLELERMESEPAPASSRQTRDNGSRSEQGSKGGHERRERRDQGRQNQGGRGSQQKNGRGQQGQQGQQDRGGQQGKQNRVGQQNQPNRGGQQNQSNRGGQQNQSNRGGQQNQSNRGGQQNQSGRGGQQNQSGRGGQQNQSGRGGQQNQSGRGGQQNQPNRQGQKDQPGRQGQQGQQNRSRQNQSQNRQGDAQKVQNEQGSPAHEKNNHGGHSQNKNGQSRGPQSGSRGRQGQSGRDRHGSPGGHSQRGSEQGGQGGQGQHTQQSHSGSEQ